MVDVVVTVPKNFTHPNAPGKRGLAAWLAEGDAPGTPDSGTYWYFALAGALPKIEAGERVYVVCESMLVGYAPLVMIEEHGPHRAGRYFELIRRGGAMACTIDERITGFRGWRYRWWEREAERPLDLTPWLTQAEVRR